MVGVTLRLRKSPLKSKSSANENRDCLVVRLKLIYKLFRSTT